MPLRDVVRIDEELCDGCGLCVPSCAEGAIAVIDGKARLVSEALCDGLGACLGHCPQGAITVEKIEAAAFDEEAVAAHLGTSQHAGPASARAAQVLPVDRGAAPPSGGGCPGSRAMTFDPTPPRPAESGEQPSALRQWPIQLHLLSPGAPYFRGADVLLAADCVAFALGSFHRDLLAGRSLAIACPKLDSNQEVYLEKLTAMVVSSGVRSLTVVVMEVPCCSGLVRLAQAAVARAGRVIPLRVVVVGVRGDIVHEETVEVPLGRAGAAEEVTQDAAAS